MVNRRVLLIDGFSAHQTGIDLTDDLHYVLTNVRIELLPANATSVCQPLDQASFIHARPIIDNVGCVLLYPISKRIKIQIRPCTFYKRFSRVLQLRIKTSITPLSPIIGLNHVF
jgi:DDE superfamily endonuclease